MIGRRDFLKLGALFVPAAAAIGAPRVAYSFLWARNWKRKPKTRERMATKKKRPTKKTSNVRGKLPRVKLQAPNAFEMKLALANQIKALDDRTAAANEAANRLGQMADALEQTLQRATQRIVEDADVPTIGQVRIAVLKTVQEELKDKHTSHDRLHALAALLGRLEAP